LGLGFICGVVPQPNLALGLATAGFLLWAQCTPREHPFHYWWIFIWFGTICYGMYLWHVPVLGALVRLFPQADVPLRAWVALPIVLVLSTASWLWIELPIVCWGKRYRNSRSGFLRGVLRQGTQGVEVPNRRNTNVGDYP